MKKIIIGVLVIIEIFSLYMMYQSNENKNNVLNEVNIKDNKINKNTFAIYWDENGTGKYTEYKGDSWPGEGFVLDLDNTECMNEKGEKLNNDILSYNDNNLTLISNNTTYCTLYFGRIPSLGTFCSEEANMGECMNNKKETIGSLDNITSTIVGGMYRYQGTDNVNNWICFGTTNKEECTSGTDNYGDGIDKYMYRIIGVTEEGELVLLKETVVKEESEIAFQWDDKNNIGECVKLCPWVNTKIYNRLNGLCKEGNTNCSGTGTGSSGQTNIFIGINYYGYLQDDLWLNKISDHEWKYGDTNENDGNYNGDSAYAIENAFTDSVSDAKIGLQYIHDYYYAYPGGNPENYEIAPTSWIHFKKDSYNTSTREEWLISKYAGVRSYYVQSWSVDSHGGVYYDRTIFYLAVRPVFYLSPSVKINNASGSKDDPFIITN